DSLRAPGQVERLGTLVRLITRLRNARQKDSEHTASANPRVDLDPSTMLLYDAIDGRKPKSRAAPHLFGREKRFKDARQDLRCDTAARISDAETNELPSPPGNMGRKIVVGDRQQFRCNCEL